LELDSDNHEFLQSSLSNVSNITAAALNTASLGFENSVLSLLLTVARNNTLPSTISNPFLKNCRIFSYRHDLDTNGVIYHLNKESSVYEKPVAFEKRETGHTSKFTVTVNSSGMDVGTPMHVISREQVKCWSQNRLYSWYCIDLGSRNALIPTNYTLGYASNGDACFPRNWILQASNKFSHGKMPNISNIPNVDPFQNDPDWKTISIHEEDLSINSEWGTHTWKLNCKCAYRYYRLVQTGPNSFQKDRAVRTADNDSEPIEDNWSYVFVVNRFELYGILLPAYASTLFTSESIPVRYGNSVVSISPFLIRADPEISKQIQEVLLILSRAKNEASSDKVTVDEIII